MTAIFNRLAIVVLVLGIVAMAALSLTKTSGELYEDCGRWWETSDLGTDAEMQEMLDTADEIERFAPELSMQSRAAVQGVEECRDAHEGRRTLTLWVGGATVLLPVGLVFVGRATRETVDA